MSQHSSPPVFDADYITATSNTQGPSELYIRRAIVGAFILLFLLIFVIFVLYVNAKRSSTISRRRISFVSAPISFIHLSVAAAAPVHINTGLDKASIARLPTFVCKAASSLECAVCLSEFQENEKGRVLLSCKHTFHTDCIDMWLFSHSTCPLCRTNVVPAMATSPNMPPAHEQRQEGEAQEVIEHNLPAGTSDGNPVVENVLFGGNQTQYLGGNQTQAVSSQEPSSSPLPLMRPLPMSGARALPQITIDIPPIEGNSLVVSVSGSALSAKCTTQQEACSSQPVKSQGLRTSISRMLSRQSSRHKSSCQEGYEGSPK